MAGCRPNRSQAGGRQLIVLGVDGMDPGFIERHWADLPNLARMRSEGSFSRLATTNPAQSPTAWSTFITGLDPAEHGIFDFVHRDPTTMEPFLSYAATPEQARFRIPLGPYELPLSRSKVMSLRHGKPFWQMLGEHGIPATIIRMPTNYPPVESGAGLSGMGTPDLQGTQGTFTYFTDDTGDVARIVNGGMISRAEVKDGRAVLRVEGPPNSLRKDRRATYAELTVDVDPARALARLSAADTVAILKEGEWSDWLPVNFAMLPHLVSVRGMVRVYAKQFHPQFELYVSPVNVDPDKAALPISAPVSFSRDISRDTGKFYTLGIPEDTAAMRQGVFDLAQFLKQSELVMSDERKLLDYSLGHFQDGLLFFYFSSVDQNSHMLWGQHDAELLKVYRNFDAALGEVRRRKPGTEVMVMSDHGFTSFDRAVDLNRWLQHQGLLASAGGKIDWAHTKAYVLGLNAIYLNMAGPERTSLLQQIRTGLLELRDPADGRAAVETVVELHPSAENARIAPDLEVGYARGYRTSWVSGEGGVSGEVFSDNTDAWIADHCVNPEDVPGVLFTSRKTEAVKPRLKDLPVSLLEFFGITPNPAMTGHSIYK